MTSSGMSTDRLRPSRRTVLLGLAASAATSVVAAPTAWADPAPYEAVHYWSKIFEDTVKKVGGAPGPITRAVAIMHLSMYDAANSVTPIGRPYLAKQPLSGPTSLNAAIATAAYTVLRGLFPSVYFDGNYGFALSQDAASVPQADKDRGAVLGRAAAEALLKARADDGSNASATYTPDGVPGAWRPTGREAAATPQWGNVRPFGLTAPAQFRPPLPGGFTTYDALLRSTQYADQVNEVRVLGGHADTPVTQVTRTADQTQIAGFWANDLDGTYKPPMQLFQHTRIIARKYALNVTQNARLFALLGAALADAGIACWDAKYNTAIDLWRPVSAITLADTDANASTPHDPAWRPLSSYADGTSFTPPFPAYVSGHATFAGAWSRVLQTHFNTDAITFSATTTDTYEGGITRRFTTLSAAADENARSRVYLGVHYRWDSEQGLRLGDSVARHVTDTLL
ncbi:vanadium-dependent haloperoxidase [Streptomyces formicae]|uniref:Vanadium chloroperoxidase n=1 Tax=Streptomyces formicae TaxID=1616117 RepID=A0A291Q7Z3_9ACTN|nr:vanadium-dependent haloperoxidase [Streptomyces formicae]ATL27603.1 Vanadium chloroperoxidase [Streptomyces formicae]